MKRLIKSSKNFSESINLLQELHRLVHRSKMSGYDGKTYCDDVYDGVQDEAYAIMPTKKDVTLAWNIWHITRIEDIVANILIAEDKQVLNGAWHKKLGTDVTDTGNAMTDEEIISLSKEMNIKELKNYRDAVGRKTEKIIKSIKPQQLKQKAKQESLDRIMLEGCLTEQKASFWLKDFWGKKTVAGLLLLPITRHHIMHLDDCMKLKNKILDK